MDTLSFDELVAHLGEFSALNCVEEIEKAAGIQKHDVTLDPHTRLTYACQIQDEKKGRR